MPTPSAETLAVFRANPWFSSLPQPEQQAMLACAQPMRLVRSAQVFHKGQSGTSCYGVVRGLIKISSVAPDGREGILALVEPGNWFNESTVLDGLPTPYDATALENAQLLVIAAEGFAALMQRQPFAAAMARLEAQRLRALFGVMDDAKVRDMGTRVARRLLTLAHGDATMTAAPRNQVRVSQDDLAMMLGVTRQTMAKELQALVDAGVLALGYKCIDIVDVAALQRMGNPYA